MEALLSNPHDLHDRKPSGESFRQLQSAMIRAPIRVRYPGPARRRSHRDPRRATEALTPPPWN